MSTTEAARAAASRRVGGEGWLLAAALAVAVATVGMLAARQVPRTPTDVSTGAPAGTAGGPPAPAISGAGPEAYYDLRGGTPATPASRLGVAFLALGQPFEDALAALGPPASTFPDIGGTASTWPLGDARLTVSAWGDDRSIAALNASVPAGSPVRIGAFGVVIGRSTLSEVVEAWGGGFTPATSAFDDHVVSYVECAGPAPVVVKFDQAAATEEEFAPTPGSPLWGSPVTSVLVAYADEPSVSSGCPAP
ncbi:MAG: hypothetical protein ACLGIO_13470 [Acidimicrobiia bacterium]